MCVTIGAASASTSTASVGGARPVVPIAPSAGSGGGGSTMGALPIYGVSGGTAMRMQGRLAGTAAGAQAQGQGGSPGVGAGLGLYRAKKSGRCAFDGCKRWSTVGKRFCKVHLEDCIHFAESIKTG